MERTDNRLVEVTFFTAIRRSLSYRIPDELAGAEFLGRRVVAPLGRRKQVGIITALDVVYEGETKAIDSFPDLQPIMAKTEIEFCRFIADYYFASLGDVIRTFLPAPLTARLNQKVIINSFDRLRSLQESGDKVASEILQIAGKRNEIAADRLAHIRGDKLKRLLEEEIIAFDWQVKEGRKADADELVELVGGVPIPPRLGEKPKLVLAYLENKGTVDLETIKHDLKLQRSVITKMEEQGLVRIVEKPPFVDHPTIPFLPVTLNEQQSQSVDAIVSAIHADRYAPFLLHGVTGSGKTEVYIAAIQAAVAMGKTAIVIVPEIGLSQALYYRLQQTLGRELGLIHSRMTARSRLEIGGKLDQEMKIVLGPRSAIFSSLPNLGLIVVDEEHDQSLKQSSPAPRYHARDLAVYRAQQEKCVVVLGSATPSVESYHNALAGKYRMLKLSFRIEKREMPVVNSIDLKNYFKRRGFTYLSDVLLKRITVTLANSGQVMLLLNRRGFAPSVHCFSCGAKFECKNCAVSLVYHKARHKMVCHLCGYFESYPESCPNCRSNLFLYKGVGTEKLEEELHRQFPDASIVRMDLDSTRRKGSFENIYHRFKSGRAQILVGTEMISKGFDFPDVALVGIVSADTSLEVPDFRARERAFQLLTQASGRAGRLNFPGEVLLQTVHPEDATIALAAKHDFVGFYEREIKDRLALDFPPYTHLILIAVESPSQELAQNKVELLRTQLRQFQERIYQILGPIQAPIFKRRNLYRFHLLIKTKKVKMTLSCLDKILTVREFHPSQKLHVIVDVDAVDMM